MNEQHFFINLFSPVDVSDTCSNLGQFQFTYLLTLHILYHHQASHMHFQTIHLSQNYAKKEKLKLLIMYKLIIPTMKNKSDFP